MSVVSCLAMSYLVDRISPVPPISNKDIVETTSVVDKSIALSKEAVPEEKKNVKDIFQLYVSKTISLENALELLLKNGDEAKITELYSDVLAKIAESEDQEKVYYTAFKDALVGAYPFLKEETTVPEIPPQPPAVLEGGSRRRRHRTPKNRNSFVGTVLYAES